MMSHKPFCFVVVVCVYLVCAAEWVFRYIVVRIVCEKLPAIGRRLVVQATFAVLLVRHLDRLRLVTRQLDRTTNVGCDLGTIATFAQQRIDGLQMVPAYKHIKSTLEMNE